MKNILILIFLTSITLLPQNNRIKVYIDCLYCDMDFIRTEIKFVDYVIERQAADVFVMITTQSTGGGGQKYSVEFTGKGNFEKIKDDLKFDISSDDTSDTIRNRLVKFLKIGLLRFISSTPLTEKISITFEEETEKVTPEDDWDSWVFNIGGNGYFNASKAYESRNISGYSSVNRVTDEWIFSLSFYLNHNFDNYKDYGLEVTSESKSSDISVVKSITDHWSAGIVSGWNRSTYSNRENYSYLYPRIEYNIFPYSESSRRMLRIMYGIGANYSDYYETTIFGKDEELRYKHSLETALTLKREWGSIYLSVTGSTYLHDFEKRRLDSFSMISLRIVKGLSFNLSGGYSRINDQIGLSAVGYTDEEILLQKGEMATSYSYWSSIGFSYTFGSIYNNVVNPRFGN